MTTSSRSAAIAPMEQDDPDQRTRGQVQAGLQPAAAASTVVTLLRLGAPEIGHEKDRRTVRACADGERLLSTRSPSCAEAQAQRVVMGQQLLDGLFQQARDRAAGEPRAATAWLKWSARPDPARRTSAGSASAARAR